MPIAVFAIVVALIISVIAWQVAEDDADPLAGSDNPFLGGGNGGPDGGDETPTYAPADVPAEYGTIQNETGERTAVFSRSGGGDGTSPAFRLSGGLVKVHLEHFGDQEAFAVKFLRDGQIEGALAAPSGHFGAYEAERYIPLPAGDYVFEVTADGGWFVEIWYPDDDGAVAAPGTLSGDGPFVAPPAVLPAGDTTVRFQHFEAGSFEVVIYHSNGTRLLGSQCQATSPPDEPYDRSKTCLMPTQGLYYFDVQATGRWSISF